MADISNPQVVTWANERARTIADQMTALLDRLLAYQADYTAQGIAALIIAAGSANNIGDSAVSDGRQIITGNSVLNLKAAIDQLVTAWNVTAVPGVGATVSAVQNGIQVKGSSR
jgi:hypothetical protein